MSLFIGHMLHGAQTCLAQCLACAPEQSHDTVLPMMVGVLRDSVTQMRIAQLYNLLYSSSTRALAQRIDAHDPLRKTDTFSTWRMLLDMDTLNILSTLQASQYRIEANDTLLEDDTPAHRLFHWEDDSWGESSTTYYELFVDALDSAWTDYLENTKHPVAHPSSDPARLCYTFADGVVRAHIIGASDYAAFQDEQLVVYSLPLDGKDLAAEVPATAGSATFSIPVAQHLQQLVQGGSVSWNIHAALPQGMVN